ncbi:guanylate-binding protein 4-like [Misgurnus anguillicaudatus]|uniref:guanylate-binding protein 4-like n=1 Tax=Misgurnus anguillicaudatus TaxID=75329 RepID=UPI003CCFD470
MEDQDFVRKHFSALVERVTSVMPIADKLLANNMITQEKHSKITARVAHQDKIRLLLSVVNSGDAALKLSFFKVLKEEEPILIQELEGLKKDGTEVAIKRTQSRKRQKTMEDQERASWRGTESERRSETSAESVLDSAQRQSEYTQNYAPESALRQDSARCR